VSVGALLAGLVLAISLISKADRRQG
jgi:hypothetical protein